MLRPPNADRDFIFHLRTQVDHSDKYPAARGPGGSCTIFTATHRLQGSTIPSCSLPHLPPDLFNRLLCNSAGIESGLVEEVYMGNVVSAGIGQAPAKQATIYAGKRCYMRYRGPRMR